MVVPGGETGRARQKPKNTEVSRMCLGGLVISLLAPLLPSLGLEPPGSTPQGFFPRGRMSRAPT